jgi:hypothetical protein
MASRQVGIVKRVHVIAIYNMVLHDWNQSSDKIRVTPADRERICGLFEYAKVLIDNIDIFDNYHFEMFDKQMVEIVQQIDEAAKRCFE